jgi:hypothetical protein
VRASIAAITPGPQSRSSSYAIDATCHSRRGIGQTSYVYVNRPLSKLIQLRRDLRRLLLGQHRLVHVAPVLQTDVRVVGGAGHRHERT